MNGTYPVTLLEALALHDILEWLGYSKETEIFLVLTPKDVEVLLKADGRTGTIRIGSPELPVEEMERRWLDLITEWNRGGTMSEEEKDRLVQSSYVWSKKTFIIVTLMKEGFNRWTSGMSPSLN